MARGLDFRVDIDKAMLKLGRIPDDVRDALKAELSDLAGQVRDKAKSNASTMFQVRSGTYVNSIAKSVRAGKTSVIARVYSNDPVAHLLERGVRPHDIRPVNATELAFLSYFGAQSFAKMVHHPGFQGHAVFSDAFFDTIDEIRTGVAAAAKQAAASATA